MGCVVVPVEEVGGVGGWDCGGVADEDVVAHEFFLCVLM
ncbi:hypothetical protein J2S37_000907 [Corynebacterium felinum]|uniref:Uncharacterized protein n=1 Tax=Corynebacterium felinum TaxID=131318 RepID=A0ABU2B6X5_9CORY|nr:hypothetical protein [Corynebacterium felinum]